MRIINVTADNVDELGFFCLMSRRNSEGYRRKLNWLKDRFDEVLRIKMLDLSEGGSRSAPHWRPTRARV